jgi:hypothetical protein
MADKKYANAKLRKISTAAWRDKGAPWPACAGPLAPAVGLVTALRQRKRAQKGRASRTGKSALQRAVKRRALANDCNS